MKISKITYEETGAFAPIVIDYLNGKQELKSYYNYKPELTSFIKAAEAKKNENIDRELLFNIIKDQYSGFTLNEKVKANIESFRDKKTFCIVTAHQLNIFTGPLYVIYKTISVINLCRELKENYPQFDFIPVFWLGSEDHDFEEINHVNLFGKTYTWPDQQGGACGQYHPGSLRALLDELKTVIGDSERGKYVHELFSKAYLGHNTLAQSARYYLDQLFCEHGLVVVDGNDIELKKVCSPIVEDELMHHTSFSLVSKTIEELEYASQAPPREINLFYLKDKLRERIIRQGNDFIINNTDLKFSFDEILTELDEHPERFSPNVILRPLFQQKVLPSIAYIGGGSEVAYWLQLKSLFGHYQVQFPIVILRSSALVIEAAGVKKMNKLNLSALDLFKPEEELIKKYLKENAGELFSLANEKNELQKLFQHILDKALKADASLDKAVLAEQKNFLNAIDKLESKFVKTQKAKAEIEVNMIRAIKQKLFPGNGLQERTDNFIPYYLKFGDEFFNSLYEALKPLDGQFVILSESDPIATIG